MWTRHQAVWTHKTVRQVVTNEVYVGVAWNGEHRREESHPKVVGRALFERANRARGVKPQGPSDGYLRSGLVRCHGCGYAMTHAVEEGRRYYRCRAAQHGDGRLPAPVSVPAEALEPWVRAEFVARYLGEQYAATDTTGT